MTPLLPLAGLTLTIPLALWATITIAEHRHTRRDDRVRELRQTIVWLNQIRNTR